jgi:hypothetical protein
MTLPLQVKNRIIIQYSNSFSVHILQLIESRVSKTHFHIHVHSNFFMIAKMCPLMNVWISKIWHKYINIYDIYIIYINIYDIYMIYDIYINIYDIYMIYDIYINIYDIYI